MSLPPQWNLICEDGHRWCAAEPMVFVDRECGARKRDTKGFCHKKLSLIRSARPKPKPKPKRIKRKKLIKARRY